MKIDYREYLWQMYPCKQEFRDMLPTGNPNGDNYGDIHIPGHTKIKHYRCHGLLGFGGYATVYDVTEKPHGLKDLFDRNPIHYACKIADLSHASINGGNAEEIAKSFLQEINLYYKMKKNRLAGVLPIEAHTPIPEIQRAIQEARKSPNHTVNTKLMMLTPVGLSYETFLASLVDSGKIRRLTVKQACAMFLDIAEAILQLHKQGILHRDLKPDNIYLYPETPLILRACLADFNVSRSVQVQKGMQGLTQITGVGTAAYASPYLKTHNVADLPREIALRLDTYSLGVICYTILNNQKISVGSDGKVNYPLYSPSKELSELVLQMMEPDPHRALSMEEVVRALYKILTSTPRPEKPTKGHPYLPYLHDKLYRRMDRRSWYRK